MDKNSTKTNEILNNEQQIFQIIKEADSINKYFQENLNRPDTNYLITLRDIKIFQFFFKYIFKSLKFKDINVLFRLKNKKIRCKNESSNNDKLNNLFEKSKFIIPKFINFCLFNHIQLTKIFHKSGSFLLDNILKITKILFLNDFIRDNDFNMIIFLQSILCLYKNNTKPPIIWV